MPWRLLRGSAIMAGMTRRVVMSPMPITSQFNIGSLMNVSSKQKWLSATKAAGARSPRNSLLIWQRTERRNRRRVTHDERRYSCAVPQRGRIELVELMHCSTHWAKRFEVPSRTPGYGCPASRLTQRYAETEFFQKNFSAATVPLPEKYSRTRFSTCG